jgi:hypothetical protein
MKHFHLFLHSCVLPPPSNSHSLPRCPGIASFDVKCSLHRLWRERCCRLCSEDSYCRYSNRTLPPISLQILREWSCVNPIECISSVPPRRRPFDLFRVSSNLVASISNVPPLFHQGDFFQAGNNRPTQFDVLSRRW